MVWSGGRVWWSRLAVGGLTPDREGVVYGARAKGAHAQQVGRAGRGSHSGGRAGSEERTMPELMNTANWLRCDEMAMVSVREGAAGAALLEAGLRGGPAAEPWASDFEDDDEYDPDEFYDDDDDEDEDFDSDFMDDEEELDEDDGGDDDEEL